MAVAQTGYTEKHTAGRAGLLVNPSTCDVDSYEFEGATAGQFGYAVRLGSDSDNCRADADFTTKNLLGVLVMDKTLQPIQDDEFVEGDIASVLYRGVIWVPVKAAVTPGDLVTVETDGQFSTGSPGLGRIEVTSGGTGHSSKPTISFSGGRPVTEGTSAAAQVSIGGGAVTSIGVSTAGSGYLNEPTVGITGTGAAATAFLNRIPIHSARYLTAAAAGELAQLRLDGAQPGIR